MADIVERLLAFYPPYGWPEERSTIVEPPLNKVAADTIEALRAENARLQILLDGRDLFIVENGLWRQFVDDADGLKIRAEAARAAMGESDDAI